MKKRCFPAAWQTASVRFARYFVIAITVLFLTGCGGGEGVASAMQLIRTEGSVGVSDEKGESVPLMENLSLYGGYRLGTEEESHAWIDLDAVKLAKMDEESEIEIQKEGKDLEILVNSGGLFFYVAEPLGEDETLNIRTSTMLVGIRGTCGWVQVVDESHMQVFILEGTVECTVTDPESGESKTESVSAGEKAELALYQEEDAPDGEKCGIIKEELTLYEVPFYVLEELLADGELGGDVAGASGLEIPTDGLPESYVALGRQYLAHEGEETALRLSEMAIEADPECARAYPLRGGSILFSGETEENMELAQADYEKALELDEAVPEAWLGLADLCIRQNDLEGALGFLETGLARTGNNDELQAKIQEIESGTVADSQGRQRRYSAFDESGSLMWYHEYYYDTQGKRIKAVSYDAAGAQTGSGEYIYNEANKLIQGCTYSFERGILSKVTNEYDAEGNIVRVENYSEEGELRSYNIRQYDENNHLTRTDNYDEESNRHTYFLYGYDENGNQTNCDCYDSDGTLNSYSRYEFDENGNGIKDSHYDRDGKLTFYIIYEYDSEGNRVSSQRFEP